MKKQVKITSNFPLHKGTKKNIREKARDFLQSHWYALRSPKLNIRLKEKGGKVECHSLLFTDDGSFRSYLIHWDTSFALKRTLNSLGTQVSKFYEKQKDFSLNMTGGIGGTKIQELTW